uniref:Major facilitator superfamily (MFS) profile domain-containing protein n=3 Tax=Glossina TaxID=7393 RepID=A0A1B0BSA0_9MUSC
MDFERVLEKCGNFGRYQIILLLIFGYTNMMSSMHYFSQTLISFTPNHWCYHEKLANLSYEHINLFYKNLNNPKCTLLDDIVNDTNPVVAKVGECNEWFYEREQGYESITSELNWVCDRAYQSAVGKSFFYVGSVVGTILFGILADKYGRVPAIILTTLSGGLGDFMTAFVNDLPAFIVARFISGLSNDTFFMLMFILVFEYLKPEKRTFGLNIITATFYCAGLMLSPWFAIWVGSWRKYLILVSTPVLLVLVYPLVVCESARWLLTQQNYSKAVECLKYVAKINKRKVDESVFDEFVEFYKQKLIEEQKLDANKDTFLGMFSSPRLRKFTIILLVKSVIITMAYDIASRNMEGLGSSPFALFSYSSICYIPGGLTIILFQNVIGRKGMACSSLFVGGLLTAVTGFLIAVLDRQTYALLLAIMVALGRYGAIVAYDAEAQYATEIIPTSVRGRGVSNIHVVGYACSFLNAYVIYLGNFYKPLPSLFISFIMLVGAGLCLALPETHGKKLPESLSEGEVFGLNEDWYYFPCFERKRRNSKISGNVGNESKT